MGLFFLSFAARRGAATPEVYHTISHPFRAGHHHPGRARVIFCYSLRAERSFALPLYEYKCVKCGHRFEKIESVSSPTSKKCPKCGAKAARMLSAPAIQFKGSGWYVTDYAGKKPDGSASEKAGEGEASKTKEKTGEAKSSESSKSSESAASSEKSPAKKKK
jgi:putative FmdB family regulatory protein